MKHCLIICYVIFDDKSVKILEKFYQGTNKRQENIIRNRINDLEEQRVYENEYGQQINLDQSFKEFLKEAKNFVIEEKREKLLDLLKNDKDKFIDEYGKGLLNEIVEQYNIENETNYSVKEALDINEIKKELASIIRDSNNDVLYVSGLEDGLIRKYLNYIDNRIKILADILKDNGYNVIVDKSEQSESTYIYLKDKELSIRLSGHSDRYGSDINLNLSDSIEQNIKDIQENIKSDIYYQSNRVELTPEQFRRAREVSNKIFKQQLSKFRKNSFNGKNITVGVMLPYYQEVGLSGVLKARTDKIASIKDKHPEAWQHIDNTMEIIDSPMAIMESQNKKEPYTIIALTDIVSKDIRENESVLAYFLRPTEDGSVMVSTYNMNNVDIDKHIKGLIATDKKKAENVSRVGVTDKALAISIMNTLSAKDSIADLKEKYNSKMITENYPQNNRGEVIPKPINTPINEQSKSIINILASGDKSTLVQS